MPNTFSKGNEQMDNLKKCPFCGGKPVIETRIQHSEGNNVVVIRCEVCGASTKLFNESETDKGYRMWNMRVGE